MIKRASIFLWIVKQNVTEDFRKPAILFFPRYTVKVGRIFFRQNSCFFCYPFNTSINTCLPLGPNSHDLPHLESL